MYFPKSQIKPNQFTSGNEFIILSTGENYSGYYHELSNGKTFTGRTPNDFPINEIIRSEGSLTEEGLPINEISVQVPNQYTILKNIEIGVGKIIPLSYIPNPQPSDFELGEINRYFIRHISNFNFIEINKEDYNKVKNKDNSIFWKNYKEFFIPWKIKGDKELVYKTNFKTVQNIIIKEKLIGFDKFLNNNYVKFLKND
jgi:hypothetical protein